MGTLSPVVQRSSGFTEETFEAFLRERDEPAWLLERRRDAFARFQAFALPSARDEEWRRTDIRALKIGDFSPTSSTEPSAADRESFETLWKSSSAHYPTGIAHLAGALVREADPSLLGRAVFIDLGRAVKDHPELLKRYLLTEAVLPGADYFSALHAAFWTGGTLLYVPRGARLEAPLYALAGMGSSGRVEMSHTLVVLEEGAEATLVREAAGLGPVDEQGLHVGALEVFQAQGSHLRLVNIQNWDLATWHFSRERAIVGADARLQWTVGGLGSRLSKVNQEVALAGNAGSKGPGQRGHVHRRPPASGPHFTRQDHIAPHTTSDLLYKAGLKGKSRIVWKGMIRVEKDAQRTDAYQKNDNLVLSQPRHA